MFRGYIKHEDTFAVHDTFCTAEHGPYIISRQLVVHRVMDAENKIKLRFEIKIPDISAYYPEASESPRFSDPEHVDGIINAEDPEIIRRKLGAEFPRAAAELQNCLRILHVLSH